MSTEKKCNFTSIGGQAVIEGIMMRGPKTMATAVRTPGGEITIKKSPVTSIGNKYPILKLPFIRGSVNFVEMMLTGYKTLEYSAEQAGLEDETEEPSKFEIWFKNTFGDKGFSVLMTISALLGVLLALLLFIYLPTAIVSGFEFITKLQLDAFRSLIEGILRIAIFTVYVLAVSRMKEIRRTFEYHGAEHKTIFCYEQGLELTPENARKMKRLHPRCGTSFLLIAMVCGILVGSLVNFLIAPLAPPTIVRVLLKLVILPVVVGISYEVIKFAGRHDNAFTRIISAPGMWFQRLTTKEPDDSMLEVAIAALKAVLPDTPEWEGAVTQADFAEEQTEKTESAEQEQADESENETDAQ